MTEKLSRRGFLKGVALVSTMPLMADTEEGNNLKFIHVTDSHMDLNDPESIDAMELMVEFINTNYKDLDFVCFGGDNFNNNVEGDADARMFKKITDKLHCKTVHVRGNKESSLIPDGTLTLTDFQKLFVDGKGFTKSGKDFAYEKNGYIFLGLDSCITGKNNGAYTQETITFAKKMLSKGKPTVFMNHHPYTNFWGETNKNLIHNYILNNTQEVQKELFGYENLILTLSGHKHVDSVKEIQGTKVIATRGFIRPLDMDMFPMRYVELQGNTINEKLIYTDS